MLPSSLAFTWVLWWRHRWGLLVVLSALLLAGILAAVVPLYWPLEIASNTFVIVIIPVLVITGYLMVIFTYGSDAGDVLARESCFPTRLFRLPLRTSALVLWPMAFGAATVLLLWLATSYLILRPWLGLWKIEVPLWLPAFWTVAFLAWLQAILWTPFGLPWLRIILVFIMIQIMICVPGFGLRSGLSERSLVGVLASLTVVAWVLGYIGVRHARRGDVPNWEWIFSAPSRLVRAKPQRRLPFTSAAHAQMWFQWCVAGPTLPLITGFMLPLTLLPLIVSIFDRDAFDRNAWATSLLGTLAVPVFFSGIAGGFENKSGRGAQGRAGMMPFIATVPMTTADMVGAMLKVATSSTVATWALIAVAWPLTVVLTGNVMVVIRSLASIQLFRHHLNANYFRMAALIVAIIIVLFVWTWKRRLDRLYIGLIGSEPIEAALAVLSLPAFYILCFFVATFYVDPHRFHHEITLIVWPWLVGALLLFRLLTAAWALREALRQGLLQRRTVGFWVAGWLLLAAALLAMLALAMPPGLVPLYDLACGITFALPIVRLAVAPLALAWQRHR